MMSVGANIAGAREAVNTGKGRFYRNQKTLSASARIIFSILTLMVCKIHHYYIFFHYYIITSLFVETYFFSWFYSPTRPWLPLVCFHRDWSLTIACQLESLVLERTYICRYAWVSRQRLLGLSTCAMYQLFLWYFYGTRWSTIVVRYSTY